MDKYINKEALIEKIKQVSPELKDYRDPLCNESEFTPFQAASYTYVLILSIVEDMPYMTKGDEKE